MSRVVPKPNHRLRLVVLVSQSAEACGIEQEITSREGRQSQPARGQNAEEMSAGEEQHVPMQGPYALDDPVGSGTHLLRGFAARTTVSK